MELGKPLLLQIGAHCVECLSFGWAPIWSIRGEIYPTDTCLENFFFCLWSSMTFQGSPLCKRWCEKRCYELAIVNEV